MRRASPRHTCIHSRLFRVKFTHFYCMFSPESSDCGKHEAFLVSGYDSPWCTLGLKPFHFSPSVSRCFVHLHHAVCLFLLVPRGTLEISQYLLHTMQLFRTKATSEFKQACINSKETVSHRAQINIQLNAIAWFLQFITWYAFDSMCICVCVLTGCRRRCACPAAVQSLVLVHVFGPGSHPVWCGGGRSLPVQVLLPTGERTTIIQN